MGLRASALRPQARDAAAAAAFAILYIAGGYLALRHGWYPAPDALNKFWGAGATTVVVLLTRDRWPVTTLLTVVVFYPVVYGHAEPRTNFYFLPVFLAVYTIAAKGRLPILVILVLTELSFVRMLFTYYDLTHPYMYENDFWYWHPSEVALMQVCLFAVLMLGRATYRQSRTTAELRQRNEELQRLRRIENDQLVSAERTRIARELHDVVAHHISAVVIRAQAADRVADAQPEQTREAVRWIAASGQETLTAMRQVVRVLRSSQAGVLLTPEATLAELPRIAERMNAVGLPVELRLPPEPLPVLPTAVELATVRIVQEALTNVLVHARARRALVKIDLGPGTQLRLAVHDDGRSGLSPVRPVSPVAATPRPIALAPTGTGTGTGNGNGNGNGNGFALGGNGLIGMRERAASCGGTLVIGRSPLGGWSVTAVLSLTPAGVGPQAGSVLDVRAG